jgi:DNA polymerase III alpha subunit
VILNPIELEDRLLWADGVISVSPEKLSQFIFKLASKNELTKLAVTESTAAVQEYNLLSDIKIEVKTEILDNLFPPKWNLPETYKYLDIDEFLIGLSDRIEQDELYDVRVQRLSYEIYLFKKLQLDEFLRMLIYVVDRLVETKSVWGVGRGSSCSSYLLFLLGLHEVDSVRYEIDVNDFIKEEN